MTDTIAISGLVATTPKHLVTGNGLSITSFRLASQQRRYDRGEQKWVDGETNWYTVATFRQLATNVVSSVQKGQRIVVIGRLRVRDWSTDDKKGTSVEIDVDAVGHDLSWGTATFTRSAAAAVAEAEAAEGAAGEQGAAGAAGEAGEQAEAGVSAGDTGTVDGADDAIGVAPERETAALSTPF